MENAKNDVVKYTRSVFENICDNIQKSNLKRYQLQQFGDQVKAFYVSLFHQGQGKS